MSCLHHIDGLLWEPANFRALGVAPENVLDRINILLNQERPITYYRVDKKVCPELSQIAKEAYGEYLKFLGSPPFLDMMDKIPVKRLANILVPYVILPSGRPHDDQLTKVVYRFLTRKDIGLYCNHPTSLAFLIAKEIANLQKASSGSEGVLRALSQFRDLLVKLPNGEPPNVGLTYEETLTRVQITDILLRYREWEKEKDHHQKDQKAVVLKSKFERELDKPKEYLLPRVATVLLALIWLLSQWDQLE
ncbi:hypothetical protein H0H93_009575 [Arthromyces matolae]|nr:hypothetical protein H0H93_009575 [Arthromyces matolae]